MSPMDQLIARVREECKSRNIPSCEIESALLEGNPALYTALTTAAISVKPPIGDFLGVYPVRVDYSESNIVAAERAVGSLHDHEFREVSQLASDPRDEVVQIEVEIISAPWLAGHEHALHYYNEIGVRPATFHELCALIRDYHRVLAKLRKPRTTIHALGSFLSGKEFLSQNEYPCACPQLTTRGNTLHFFAHRKPNHLDAVVRIK